MSRRLFLGTFEREEDLLGATAAARKGGLRVVDVYTPYAVHGLGEAMGLAPSRLSRACLAFGLVGVALALGFQFWVSAVDWPVNVGGRPWNSLPAFVPVTFEVMVLFAGLGVVLAFLAVSRLYPGKRAVMPTAEVTRGRFVLVLEEGDAAFDVASVRKMFRDHQAVATEEREEQPSASATPRSRLRLNVTLLMVLLALVGLHQVAGTDPTRPNLEFLPEMARPVPYSAFAPNPNFPDGKTLQTPRPGTIARGQLPLHYQALPADALRAGEELENPLADEAQRFAPRGAWVYANYCQVCHGSAGKGDGPLTLRGVPPPPSLLAEKALKMKDGQMFHVLTYGQGNMPSYAGQLSRQDRWSAILYVRSLQPKAEGKGKP
jgi:mono/diheme cytochrome c family protein